MNKMIMSVLFAILYEGTYTNILIILFLLFGITFPLLIYYIMIRMIDNPKPTRIDILVSTLLTAFMIFFVNFISYIQEVVLVGVVYYLLISTLLLVASGKLLIYLVEREVEVGNPEVPKKDILTLILLSALLMSTIFSALIPVIWNTSP